MVFRAALAAAWLLTTQVALGAPPIDCRGPIAQAEKEIDKVTGDLQGMETMMPGSEMTELRGLLERARDLNSKATTDCTPGSSAYVRSEAIAEATAASGYATAADILHFHYMQAPMAGGSMEGMGKKKTSGTSGMKSN